MVEKIVGGVITILCVGVLAAGIWLNLKYGG